MFFFAFFFSWKRDELDRSVGNTIPYGIVIMRVGVSYHLYITAVPMIIYTGNIK